MLAHISVLRFVHPFKEPPLPLFITITIVVVITIVPVRVGFAVNNISIIRIDSPWTEARWYLRSNIVCPLRHEQAIVIFHFDGWLIV
jgi:hypothetical protein